MLSDTILKQVFDSMAAQMIKLVATYGRTKNDSNTIARGALAQYNAIVAEMDTDIGVARDLAAVLEEYLTITIMTAYPGQMLVPTLNAIEAHVLANGYTSINNFLQTSAGSHVGFRVHPYLREIWPKLAAGSVWPLTIDTTAGTVDAGNEAPALYTFESDGAGGAGAGTAVGTDLDMTKYGDGLIQGYVASGKSVTTGATMTITGSDGSGNPVTIQFTTTAVTGPNKFAIASTSRLASVSNVAETGTTLANGDMFDIVFKQDRVPTLVP